MSSLQFIEKWQVLLQTHRSVVSASVLLAVISAHANPTGGDVVSGSASIESSGTTTTITQQSGTAIINWQDFSIGENELTKFIQPSSSSIILNRVVTNNVSKIMGRMQANGQVYLVNPNGILFGPNAVVDVGGLVASTGSISNEDFLAGHYEFLDAPADSQIINQGTITIQNGGMGAFVSPYVENQGIIVANLGTVVFAGAEHVTLDPYGDGLIQFDVGEAVSHAAVIHSGEVYTDGGRILMTVSAAEDVFDSVINVSGYVQARTVVESNGTVALLGYENSNVQIAGTIDVSGDDAHETGGVIRVSGDRIILDDGSALLAQGDAGGGTVYVGGEVQGQGDMYRADYVNVKDNAYITVDAITNGDGGTVAVWSDNHTDYSGYITARGGAEGGDGGFVETSGYQTIDFLNGRVNTLAPYGVAGMWLIDPTEITVSNAYAATLSSQLEGGNITIQTTSAGNDIQFVNFSEAGDPPTVGQAVTWSAATTFTVKAHNDIIFATTTAAMINPTGAGSVELRADTDNTGGGTVTMPSNSTVTANSGNIDIFYNPTSFPTAESYASKATSTSGTVTAYMLVNDATDLQNVNSNLSGNYALAGNISSGLGSFTPLGSTATAFTGAFDFNGYQVSNMTISALGIDDVGFFGRTASGAKFIDINVSGISVTGNKNDIGGFIGELGSGTAFEGSHTLSITNVSGGASVGGFAGNSSADLSGDTFNVTVTGTVTGTTSFSSSVGGFIGASQAGADITSSTITTNIGAVTGANINVGGFMGIFDGSISNSTISNTVGNVTGTSDSTTVAGFIGKYDDSGLANTVNSGTTFTNNVTGTITANSQYLAGFVGQMYYGTGSLNFAPGTVTNTVNKITAGGTITRNIGGFVGELRGANLTFAPSTVTNTVTTMDGTKSNQNGAGGFVGFINGAQTFNPGSITNNVTTIDMAGIFIGGFAGQIQKTGGTIDASNIKSNVTTVNGTDGVGGFVGIIANTVMKNIYVLGTTVTGSGSNASVGGIVGAISSFGATTTLQDSFTNATVSSVKYAGGVVGFHTGTLERVYSIGTVSGGSGTTGQVAGRNGYLAGETVVGISVGANIPGTIQNVAYQTNKNSGIPGVGQTVAVGTNTNVLGLTSDQMGTSSTFTPYGWDFTTVWNVTAGSYTTNGTYPFLRSCGSNCTISRANSAPVTTSQATSITNTTTNSEKTASSTTKTTTQEVITVAETSSSLTYDGLVDLVTDIVEAFDVEEGSAFSLADVNVIDFDESQFEGMTEEEKQAKVKETVETVVDALIGYYCS